MFTGAPAVRRSLKLGWNIPFGGASAVAFFFGKGHLLDTEGWWRLGDLDALKGMIEATEAEEYIRAGALQVLAYLTATGRVAREEAEAYLLRLYDTMEPQHENFVWSGWVLAIALLGLETLSGIVRQAFARGLMAL